MSSPSKPSQKLPVVLIDDEERSESPDTIENNVEEESPRELEVEVEDTRGKFIGEVDLPESELPFVICVIVK
jgi:hypothetical protein